MTQPVINSTLHALCERLQQLRKQAEAVGLFTDDRELLNCTHCGLQENVLIGGYLVTHQVDAADEIDTGLRFSAVDDHNFICPQCGAKVTEDSFD